MGILILTGDSGIGKTTVCAAIAARAKARGWTVAGILSPSRFADGQRVAIEVEDVRTGQRRLLARARQSANPSDEPATAGWRFDRRGLEWGAAVLRSAAPCALLIVDELGPLELLRGEGWNTAARDALQTPGIGWAVVVVRPALVEAFQPPGNQVPAILSVTRFNRETLPGQILALLENRE